MDEKEVVMSQGKTYKPEGDSYVSDPFAGVTQSDGQADTETSDSGDVVEIQGMHEPADRGNPFKGLMQKPMVLLGIGLAVVVVLVTVVVFGSVSAKKKAEEDWQHAEDLLEEEETYVFTYDADEIYDLRLAGYTGFEIDEFQEDERDVQELVKAAEAARYARYEEEILPYFNSASDEFKLLWRDTWVGQDDFDLDYSKEYYDYVIDTVNVDYEKLPPKGHQLFIKYFLKHDSNACFMTVTPERYAELDSSGNIVLKIEYAITDDGTKVITDAYEVIP